jgi:lysophospholipase L1-like esterase
MPKDDVGSCVLFRNFTTQASCASAWAPDVLIISGGLNDCLFANAYPNSTRAHVVAAFQRMRETMPNTHIIATPIISFSTASCIANLNDWIASAAAQVNAEFVTGADQWLVGHSDWISPDKKHPNRLGHNAIAQQFLAWYRSNHSQ